MRKTRTRIYEADYPVPFLPQQALFEYMFPENDTISPIPVWDPALPAFIDGVDGRVLHRGELIENAKRLISGLRAIGLERGDTACLWGLNSLEYAQAVYGCTAAGLVVSPANAAYAPHEIAHQVNNSGTSIIFVDPILIPNLEKARAEFDRDFPDSRIVLITTVDRKPSGSRYKALPELFGEVGVPEKFDGADAQATAFLCYSSGTTGLPKGVMTTHFNLTSQHQCCRVSYPVIESGKDVVLGVLPFSHVYGLAVILMNPLLSGVPVVVLPRWDEIVALKAIERFKVTYALLVPPILINLLHSKNMANFNISSLNTIICAAAPLSPDLQRAFQKRVPGVYLFQGYGMTETSPTTHSMNRKESVGKTGSVGRLLPTYEARLVDPSTGEDAPEGKRGELWVRGPCVMKGYHRNPEATANTMAPGGWLKTGDVLVRDKKGFWMVVDRVKELIKYKGFQVAPAELEGVLMNHPKVADAGVVGVQDNSQATELPRAYIVLHPQYAANAAAVAKEVKAWVAARVAPHKKLRGGVAVVEAIPKSPSGKILRKDLRARAQDEFENERAKRNGKAKL